MSVPLVVDVDDVWPGHDGLHRLKGLKRLNRALKVTLFSVPGRCTPEWCESLPPWIELAAHGHMHPDAHECEHWTREQTLAVLDSPIVQGWSRGWKSPGWLISDGTYAALLERGFWVADQHYNDARRPAGLRVHCEGDGNHSHHHVQDWGSNGLHESWPTLVERVSAATEFRFISEVAEVDPRP